MTGYNREYVIHDVKHGCVSRERELGDNKMTAWRHYITALKLDWRPPQGRLRQSEEKDALILDVVRSGTVVLELLSGKDEVLLVGRRDTLPSLSRSFAFLLIASDDSTSCVSSHPTS